MKCVRTMCAAVAACALLACLTGCVTVAEFRKLERDVRDLEHGGGGVATGSASTGGTRLADLAVRLDGLERDMEAQRGRLEVVEHESQEALQEARAARAAASSLPAGALLGCFPPRLARPRSVHGWHGGCSGQRATTDACRAKVVPSAR